MKSKANVVLVVSLLLKGRSLRYSRGGNNPTAISTTLERNLKMISLPFGVCAMYMYDICVRHGF